jgi:hypothetical protein
MYQKLSDKLVVTTTASPEFSFAVPMEGSNAVQAELTIYAVVAAATLTVEMQGSNDLQNWSQVLAPVTNLTVGYTATTLKATAVAFQYVRIKFSSVGIGGSVILSCGVNTSQL